MKPIELYIGKERQQRRTFYGTLTENEDGSFAGQLVNFTKAQLDEIVLPSLNRHVFTCLDDGKRYDITDLTTDGQFKAVPAFHKILAGKPPHAHFVKVDGEH